MASLFKNRVFCLVMGSDLLQQFGIWIRNMALLFFVMEMTQNNPVYVSLLTVVELAPIFLFSLIGGIYADRWNPKRTMITADLLTLLSIGVIALVLFYGYWPIIFVVTFISAMLSQFSQPSSAKIFKQHVSDDQIPIAIGLSQSIHSLFIILGPVVGTFIYTSFGVYISFICMMVIFACSATLLAFLPTNSPLDQKDLQTTPLEDLRTGWQFFMADDSLKKILIAFMIVGLGSGLIQPLEVFIVTERLGLEKESVQWLTAVAGVGLLLGGVVAASIAKRWSGKVILCIGIFITSLAIVVEALSIWPILTGTMRFLNAFFLSFVNMVIGSYFIQRVPNHFVGKVNGIISPLFMGTVLIGSSLAGSLKISLGLIPVFLLASGLILFALIPSSRISFGISPDRQNQLSYDVD